MILIFTSIAFIIASLNKLSQTLATKIEDAYENFNIDKGTLCIEKWGTTDLEKLNAVI